MDKVTISNKNDKDEMLEATFVPSHGMNLISYKKNDIEVIDQSTYPLLEQRFAGLGALIGPHFYHRKDTDIAKDFDESLFPHIARVKAKGVNEPFSHGIARYAPWKYTHSSTQVMGTLRGCDEWNGIPLKKLEGMDFDMHFEASMMPYGLFLRYYINSEMPSVLGLHYYYVLPQKKGVVRANVQGKYNDKKSWKAIPRDWLRSEGKLHFSLENVSDFGFRPIVSEYETRILLDAIDHEVHIIYDSSVENNSWQLWHPENSSFVCIEPLTALDPSIPDQTHSLLEVKIEIFS